jgi:hypothetical protein
LPRLTVRPPQKPLRRSRFSLVNANAHNADYAICPAPSADPACAVRMNKTCGNADTRLDQVPEHLLAGVNGASSVIAGALFCYGVGNDLPGRAQNGTGPFGVLCLNRET